MYLLCVITTNIIYGNLIVLVIFAPDSFKGSMTSRQAAMAMQRGIQKVFPKARCLSFPMADGGEGTLEALVAYTKGKYYYKKVTGPDRKPVRAKYGLSRDGSTAIIEDYYVWYGRIDPHSGKQGRKKYHRGYWRLGHE